MVSFLKNFTKRVIACPSCGKRSRVPVKPGSVLLVTCPACETKFEIKFENTDQRKFLIPTAEVVLTNLVRDTLLTQDQLPQRCKHTWGARIPSPRRQRRAVIVFHTF